MFTVSERVSYSFPARHGELAKYQTCLIFYQPTSTLAPDCGSAHSKTVLSCLSMSCQSHFLSCPILLPSCLKTLAGLSYSSNPKPHSTTSCKATLTVFEKKQACHKQPTPD